MAIICSTYLSTRDFHYSKDTQCFVTEASSLPGKPSRVYDDACDEGFVLVSHKTGDSYVFAHDDTDVTNDDEIAGWRFKAVAQSHRHNRFIPCSDVPFTVLIIND